jgi:hypothetical protein
MKCCATLESHHGNSVTGVVAGPPGAIDNNVTVDATGGSTGMISGDAAVNQQPASSTLVGAVRDAEGDQATNACARASVAGNGDSCATVTGSVSSMDPGVGTTNAPPRAAPRAAPSPTLRDPPPSCS